MVNSRALVPSDRRIAPSAARQVQDERETERKKERERDQRGWKTVISRGSPSEREFHRHLAIGDVGRERREKRGGTNGRAAARNAPAETSAEG